MADLKHHVLFDELKLTDFDLFVSYVGKSRPHGRRWNSWSQGTKGF